MTEPMWDADAVRARIEDLRRQGVERFGSGSHGFRLRGPLSLDEVEAFEAAHAVRLPEDYRQFVLTVGDGGAGPFYGVYSLLNRADDPDVTGFLAAEFPHSAKWNAQEPIEPDEGESEDKFAAREQAFEEWYFQAEHIAGSLAVAHFGCGDVVRLVITGPERGQIWQDGRANTYGVWSWHQTFQQWYENWLRFPGNPTGVPTRPSTPDELAFVVACKLGDVAVVRSMLADVRPELVVRGLDFAAFDAQPEVARLLLDHGVPADRLNESGTTPLMMVGHGTPSAARVALVRLLLDRGADALRRDEDGRDLLFLLTHQPARADLEAAEVLVRWAAARVAVDPERLLQLLPGRTWMLDDLVDAASS